MAVELEQKTIILERNEVTDKFASLYPQARASQEHLRRMQRGADYSLFGIKEPQKIDNKSHEKISAQMSAYLRVCDKLANAYLTDPWLRKLVHTGFLQFESPVIQELVERYPTTNLTGAKFASDIVTSGNENDKDVKLSNPFKTVEVNCGPVGGPAETAHAQSLFPETQFPVSDEFIFDHILHSTNTSYEKTTQAFGKEVKPVSQRKVVYVENDGWYPGSVIMVDKLKERGMNVEIAPREALKYNEAENKLEMNRADGTNSNVDQLMLYFHLQADVIKEPGKEDQPGEIIKALQNGAVVAETSMFPVIVLGSKVTAGIIDHIVEHPNGPLAKRLKLNAEDITEIKEMFPLTDQWRADYFRNSETGINGFSMREWLKEGKVVAKVTNGGMYGGRGVFTFKDTKEIQTFSKGIQQFVTEKLISLDDSSHLLHKLVDKKALSDFVDYVSVANKNKKFADSKNARRLSYLIDALHQPLQESDLTKYGLSAKDLQNISEVTTRLQSSNFTNKEEVNNFFNKLSHLFVKAGLDTESNGIISDIQRRLTEYLSTRMVLPLILQEKIDESNPIEYRLAGSIGKEIDDHSEFLSAMQPPSVTEPFKSMYPIRLAESTKPYSSRTSDPLNPILEIEAEAPKDSTKIELSLIPADRRFNETLVLMCGTGRHARMLAPISERIHGVDLSHECIADAVSRNNGYNNTIFEVGDVREVLSARLAKPTRYDLVTISGNSLSYLQPNEQRDLLEKIHSIMQPEGILTYDVTDIEKYSQQLADKGSVSVRTESLPDQIVQRIIKRTIDEVESPEKFYAINENLRYIIDNSQERVHELMAYYMASKPETTRFLSQIGFRNIQYAPIFDPYYASMMRNRWIVSAQK